jgi:hypothetical protein
VARTALAGREPRGRAGGVSPGEGALPALAVPVSGGEEWASPPGMSVVVPGVRSLVSSAGAGGRDGGLEGAPLGAALGAWGGAARTPVDAPLGPGAGGALPSAVLVPERSAMSPRTSAPRMGTRRTTLRPRARLFPSLIAARDDTTERRLFLDEGPYRRRRTRLGSTARQPGQLRPQTSRPPPQSVTAPAAQVMVQPPSGQIIEQPLVPPQVAVQSPPTQSTSQPPVPLQTMVEPWPTENEHGSVPLQVAVQSAPQAASQPAVPLHVATHPSPHVASQRVVAVQVQVPATQRQPRPPRPPPLQLSGPPGFGREGPQPAAHRRVTHKNREKRIPRP